MSSSILICDDSNLARKQVLRSLPDSLSTNVQLATNGQEALELLTSQSFDLLFLDLTMPILDGLGFYKALKTIILIFLSLLSLLIFNLKCKVRY